MALVAVRQRPGVLLAAAVVLHVVLISTQVNTTAGVSVLHAATVSVFAEVQRVAMAGVTGVRTVWSGYVSLRGVRAENEMLRREVHALQIRLQEEHALAQRTENLRRLLELRERAGLDTAAAEVIGAAGDPDFRTLTIDKGLADRLRSDMAVISPSGVVGRIILPTARAAQVQLLVDRNAAAGAMIERTRAQGIVAGHGDGVLRLDYLPSTADVRPGDLVVTSGIDGIYPKGFVIGTVEDVDRGSASYPLIRIRPAVDFSRIEEVLIVLTPAPGRADGER